MTKENNPMRVVQVTRADHRPPTTIQSRPKFFGEIDSSIRGLLANQVISTRQYFEPQFTRWGHLPAVAKVTLKDDALAKSHRPVALFTSRTCPIVGTLDYGELLVSATRDGLDRLAQRIESSATGRGATANITAIEAIEPYLLNDSSKADSSASIENWLAQNYELKFQLFDHSNNSTNQAIRSAFFEIFAGLGMAVEEFSYGSRLVRYRIAEQVTNDFDREILTSFIGLKSVQPMPQFAPADFNITTSPVGTVNNSLLPAPDDLDDYPVVGLVDSGISSDCAFLKPWVVATEQYVPQSEQDNVHGTMVGGLIAGAYHLNHQDERFPRSQAKLVDVQVFEKGKSLSERELVLILEEVVPKYPEVKVWNLSLGGSSATEVSSFSDFARFLDEMHDIYGCLFIIASGNHDQLQAWPQTIDFGGLDRVSSPGDSIRSLTVGSIANAHKATSLCKTEEPSPFSRRGPGPCFVPKPEVSHYGGNCTATQAYAQTGILSVGPSDVLFESLGTSFATPLVSAQAACLWRFLDSDESPCTPERVKAILIHSALLNSQLVTKETINHFGFGRPTDVLDAVYCDPNAISLLFEADLRHGGFEFERWPVPIAECLKTTNGKFRGEVYMTLVYSPITDENYPSEYCRVNVDVGLGDYGEIADSEGNTKREFTGLVPPAPKNMKDLYEKQQIEHGFRWSPVKAYQANFPRGKTVDTWRLKMKATRRAEEDIPDRPQRATLVLTFRSSDAEADVYNEMLAAVVQEGWITTPIDSVVHVPVSAQ